MQSRNINQLVADGSAPLSYASKQFAYRLLDMNIISKSSVLFDDFSQQPVSVDNISQTLHTDPSFPDQNMNLLLRSALMSGTTSFRRTLRDLKITHKEVLSQEINQRDKHQNTLLWYLTVAGLYNSIEELYRLASVDLDINVKNGSFNQTILHYTVIHGNFEDIRRILNLGIDTNLCDRLGRTALHYIALVGTKDKNDTETAKLLIDHHIFANSKDYLGQTSLHLAIEKENYDLAEFFVSLPNINVCLRNLQGLTSLCCLCKHILDLSDISFENNQYIERLERIFQIMNLLIDRCPSDKLSDYFHVMKNDKLGENLLLYLHAKLLNLTVPSNTENFFARLESIIIGTDQDQRLFVERLLDLHAWKSAVFGLCNTHNVDISNALTESIAHDPLVSLSTNILPSSDLSNFFVLLFYALATNVMLLQNIVPMCKSIIKDTQTTIDQDECGLYIDNYDLHTNYVTFIHACLHYASSRVFSLKHLCRRSIRQTLKSRIIDRIEKCSDLKLEYRAYLQFNELLLIDSKIHQLPSILHLIKRLYDSEQSAELLVANRNITSDDDTVTNRSDTIEREEHQLGIIEEIMAESAVSSDDLSDDQQIESEQFSQSLTKELNLSLATNLPSVITFSDDEISSEQLESELANMQTKSRNIEEMIDKFLSHS